MANTFKNAALADVDSTAYDTLYTCPSATTAIVLGVAITTKQHKLLTFLFNSLIHRQVRHTNY